MEYAGVHKKIGRCDTPLLRDFMRHLLEVCKLKETSVKRRIACLKVMFRWFEINEIIELNPFHRLDTRIRLPKRLPRGLTRKEIRNLIKAPTKDLGFNNGSIYKHNKNNHFLCNGKFSHFTTLVAIEVLFSTGMRVGELAGIELKDIDLDEDTISIIGKGDRERRVFIPDKEVKGLIESYISVRKLRNPETSTLLINGRNKPASTQYIRKLIRIAGETAGIRQRITPHMLRHSTATHLLEEGVDIRQVQRLLGHQSIATTQIYTQVTDSSLKAAICKAHPRKKILK